MQELSVEAGSIAASSEDAATAPETTEPATIAATAADNWVREREASFLQQ